MNLYDNKLDILRCNIRSIENYARIAYGPYLSILRNIWDKDALIFFLVLHLYESTFDLFLFYGQTGYFISFTTSVKFLFFYLDLFYLKIILIFLFIEFLYIQLFEHLLKLYFFLFENKLIENNLSHSLLCSYCLWWNHLIQDFAISFSFIFFIFIEKKRQMAGIFMMLILFFML